MIDTSRSILYVLEHIELVNIRNICKLSNKMVRYRKLNQIKSLAAAIMGHSFTT